MKIKIEGGMVFSFNDFLSAVAVDDKGNKDKARLKYDGASIVDIIAENNEQLCFIEAKNFDNLSEDTVEQEAMNKARNNSYFELADASAYAKKIISKLEHSIFLWLASGNPISKPIACLLAFNMSEDFDNNIRRILIDRLSKYIPNPEFNPLLNSDNPVINVYFDMPDTFDEYGFNVSIQQ